jgi:peptidoglycan hydrolase-like protein with peptidoglycan-binding domain
MAEALRAPKRKPARKPEHGLALRMVGATTRAVMRQPSLAFALLVFGGLGATTIINALALQSGRHPAPLFAEVRDTKPVRSQQTNGIAGLKPPKSAGGFSTAERLAEAEAPAQNSDPFILDLQNELARRGLYTGAIDGRSGAKTEAAIRKYEERVGLPVTGAPSPLILRKLAVSAEAESKGAETGNAVDNDPLRGVIKDATPGNADETSAMRKVQQALNSLGFGPLDEDGISGKATRDAIERFERSRKLPPTGDASGRTLKALQRASGIAMN